MQIINWLKDLFKKHRSTGLIIQPLDSRDILYVDTPIEIGNILQTSVDLRDMFPEVTDQNGYNSCAAHAACALLDFELKYNKKHPSWNMNSSEAYMWYYGRKRLGTEKKNSGMILRDSFKIIKEYGWVTENRWDYTNGIYTEPTAYVKRLGTTHALYIEQMKGYFSIIPGNIKSIMNALDNRHPVAFGMYTDNNYMRLKNDNPYVDKVEGTSGAHAQLIVGYFYVGDVLYFTVRNSYGNNWGVDGHSYINESVMKKSFDIWAMSL